MYVFTSYEHCSTFDYFDFFVNRPLASSSIFNPVNPCPLSRSLSASSPALAHELRKERAAAAAREKMVPNFEVGAEDGEDHEEASEAETSLRRQQLEEAAAAAEGRSREEQVRDLGIKAEYVGF